MYCTWYNNLELILFLLDSSLSRSIFKPMKPLHALAAIIVSGSLAISASAQEASYSKRGNLEFGVGINLLGPASQMADLMIEYGFDETTFDWVHMEQTEYPVYASLGLSFQAAYSKYIAPRSQLGAQLNYAWLRKVQGLSATAGDLDIFFSSIYLTPYFTYEPWSILELQVGPSLMFNTGRKTSLYDENVEETKASYTRLSGGLLAGLNVVLWNGLDYYGKIGVQYILAIPNSMGPYSATYGFDQTETIPESKIGFGHLNLTFIFGFHL